MGDSIFERSYLPMPAALAVMLLIPDRYWSEESPPNRSLAEGPRGKAERPRAAAASSGSAPLHCRISAIPKAPALDTADCSDSQKSGAGRPTRSNAAGKPVDNPHCAGRDIPAEIVDVPYLCCEKDSLISAGAKIGTATYQCKSFRGCWE